MQFESGGKTTSKPCYGVPLGGQRLCEGLLEVAVDESDTNVMIEVVKARIRKVGEKREGSCVCCR